MLTFSSVTVRRTMRCIRYNIPIMNGVILGCSGGCADLDDRWDALPLSAAVHIWVPIESWLLISVYSYCLTDMDTSEVVNFLMAVNMNMAVASITVRHITIA